MLVKVEWGVLGRREEYRVAIYVFCDGVDDYVGAVVEGVLDVGA